MFLWMNCALQKNKEKAGFQFSWSLAFFKQLDDRLLRAPGLTSSRQRGYKPGQHRNVILWQSSLPNNQMLPETAAKKGGIHEICKTTAPDSYATILSHIL